MSKAKSDVVARWTRDVAKVLVGRKIVGVRYLTNEEKDELGWHARAVVLELDNGVLVYPSQDDEGNGPGALFTTSPEMETIPVIR